MGLELVSIKESSQGCRGNGWQEWWFCLIIQIGYDYHRAGVSWSQSHSDHKQEESSYQRKLRGKERRNWFPVLTFTNGILSIV